MGMTNLVLPEGPIHSSNQPTDASRHWYFDTKTRLGGKFSALTTMHEQLQIRIFAVARAI